MIMLRSTITRVALVAGAVLLGVPTAHGQEVLLRNDDLPVTNANAAIIPGFAPGEIGAATFTLTAEQQAALLPMRVKRVQILWMSQAFALLGIQSSPVAMESINIYRGGYTPGNPPTIPTPVYFSDPPQLTDGFLNEFDISFDDVVLQPPLTRFTVGLEFDRDASAPYYQLNSILKPSLCYDRTNNGLRNPLYAIPPNSWTDFQMIGGTGDVVIRVVVERATVSNACNLADITGAGGPPAPPDGQLTLDDILTFVNAYNDSEGCPGAPGAPCNDADVTAEGGPPAPPDGQLTLEDILTFINAYNEGCP